MVRHYADSKSNQFWFIFTCGHHADTKCQQFWVIFIYGHYADTKCQQFWVILHVADLRCCHGFKIGDAMGSTFGAVMDLKSAMDCHGFWVMDCHGF